MLLQTGAQSVPQTGAVTSFFPLVGFPSALAPMQDVTGLDFMEIVSQYGSPDLFFTEYFRVHDHARIDPIILSSITENSSKKPVFAQLIGENLDHLRRFAEELQQYPIAGIDLNLGCPAPRVYRKNVGGGLLRDPDRIRTILLGLREVCSCPLTVKTRIGFAGSENFDRILDAFASAEIDLVSLHARTVKDGYRARPQYDYVARAVDLLSCPVLLNGEVLCAKQALEAVENTGAAGVMIGRSAIRNPWIFRQIRDLHAGREPFVPLLCDLYDYVNKLKFALSRPMVAEIKQVARLKKFLNFIGLSVDAEGSFLHRMRRVVTWSELDLVCRELMIDQGRGDWPMAMRPYPGLVARPSSEESACQG